MAKIQAQKLNLPALINAAEYNAVSNSYYPNIDYWYGPYDSSIEAMATLTRNGRNVLGQTVGVYVTNEIGGKEIREYWFKTSNTELELKSEGLTDLQVSLLNLLIATEGTNVTFENSYSNDAIGTVIGTLSIGSQRHTLYAPSIQYTSGITADNSTNYQQIGELKIGGPNGEINYKLWAPKQQTATLSYTDIAQGLTTIGNFQINSERYMVNIPTINYVASSYIQSTDAYTVPIGELKIGSGSAVIKAPTTEVSITSNFAVGVQLATIKVNGQDFEIYSPKANADGKVISTDNIADTNTFGENSASGITQTDINKLFYTNIETTNSSINTMESRDADADSLISELINKMSSAELTVEELNNIITNETTGLVTTVETYDNRISALEEYLEQVIDASLTNAHDLIVDNKYNINANTTDLKTIRKTINQINNTISLLNSSINTNETETNENIERLTNINNEYNEHFGDLNTTITNYQDEYTSLYQNIISNGVAVNTNGVIQVQNTIVDMGNINPTVDKNLYIPSVQAVYDALGGMRLSTLDSSTYEAKLERNELDPRTLYFVTE